MAKTNTEKPAGKAQENKQKTVAKAPKQNKEILKAPIKKEEKVEKKKETKKEVKEIKKVKKDSVHVTSLNAPVSTKYGISICKFILGKEVEKAIKEMEEVERMKRAIPMKGEYAHRKGKMMSGKYPVKAAKHFSVLLKSLKGNALNHDLENPVISEAIANQGSKVYASKGRTKKRTHIKITCKQKKEKKK